ncbi:MAG: AMP-binding protein [Gammaproteobacteria bacterium]|nr:AMP-binding protein [Gammaproteobacteria bacterium]
MFSFSVYDLLDKQRSERPGEVAVEFRESAVTYAELGARVDTVAGWLAANGVQRGDRVGIHLRKSVEEVVATFAVAKVGAVFVNINAQWTLDQLQYVAQDCDVRVLITDARAAKRLLAHDVLGQLTHILVTGSAPEEARFDSWGGLPFGVEQDACRVLNTELAALLYTSGSTGSPKGVMVSHLNIVEGARSVARYLRSVPSDRVLSLPPLSFDYGLNQVMTSFLVGATVVLQGSFMPSEIVKTLREKGVTGFPAVPPTWVEVVQYLRSSPETFPKLRYLTNTGGKIPDNILADMPSCFDGAQIFLMYGLTEAFRSTYLDPSLFHAKMGAMGQAIPNAEVFVVDPDRGICGPDEVGELVHAGSLISMGYWNKPEATAEKIHPNPHLRAILGDQPVVHSGDLVRRDSDGILWFVGRQDSMLKSSGFRISPTEVEDIVARSGQVADVVAFGVPDDALGQVLHIAVSAASEQVVDAPALLKFCTQNMPTYMVPKEVHIWSDVMPRTGSGKVDRPTVVAQCLEQIANAAAAAS